MAMEVKVVSSKLVKPAYNADVPPPPTADYVPLSVFDKVAYKMQMAIIYAFPSPAPSTAAIEEGLAAVLSVYRTYSGQIGEAPDGTTAFLLNDHGARLVEASANVNLADVAPAKPSPELLLLHPDLHGEFEEMVLVQLTRFRCGSLAMAFTANHAVADAHGASNFLVAWGKATRGLPMEPLPVHNNGELFKQRDPPRVEFDYRGREYYVPPPPPLSPPPHAADNIVMHKVHFTKDFIAGLRAKASEDRLCSRFEAILAHLWRAITRARGLGPHERTTVRVSVDGRGRLADVPAEYFGNLVLWAFPAAEAGELVSRPLKHAVQIIHDEVMMVADGAYFRSFIDFSSSGAVEAEGLAPTTVSQDVLCPDLEVDSWLRFPFYELDFGGGNPTYFMPAYMRIEGMFYLVPSYIGDGSVDAFVPLFQHHLGAFKKCCYSME